MLLNSSPLLRDASKKWRHSLVLSLGNLKPGRNCVLDQVCLLGVETSHWKGIQQDMLMSHGELVADGICCANDHLNGEFRTCNSASSPKGLAEYWEWNVWGEQHWKTAPQITLEGMPERTGPGRRALALWELCACDKCRTIPRKDA